MTTTHTESLDDIAYAWAGAALQAQRAFARAWEHRDLGRTALEPWREARRATEDFSMRAYLRMRLQETDLHVTANSRYRITLEDKLIQLWRREGDQWVKMEDA